MGLRPGWLLPAAFVLLGLLSGSWSAPLVVLGIAVVTLRYDELVSRLPSGARE